MKDTPDVPLTPDSRKAVGCAAIATLAFGTFFLLGVVALLAWRSTQSRQAQAALAEIRARGEPTDAGELQVWCALPAGTAEVSQLWSSALEQMVSASGARHLPFVGTAGDPPPPGQPWPELAAAEQLLADHAGALEQLLRPSKPLRRRWPEPTPTTRWP